MAALTGQNILDRIAGRANVTFGGGRFENTAGLQMINMVQDDILIRTAGAKYLGGRREYESSSSDNIISLSEDDDSANLDIWRVRKVTRDGTPLLKRSEAWMDKNFPNWNSEDASTSKPVNYIHLEEGIQLQPACDGIYTIQIYFIKKPTAITTTNNPFNDITQLHPYHQLIIPGAAHMLMMEIPEIKQNRKDEQFMLYEQGLKRMIEELNISEDDANLEFGMPNRIFMEEGTISDSMVIDYD